MSNRLLGVLSAAAIALSALTFAPAPAQAEIDADGSSVTKIEPGAPAEGAAAPEMGEDAQLEKEAGSDRDAESDSGAERPVAPEDHLDPALPNESADPAPGEGDGLEDEQLPLENEDQAGGPDSGGLAPQAVPNEAVTHSAAACSAANTEKEPKGDEGRNDMPNASSAESLSLGSTRCGHLSTHADKDFFKVPTGAGTYRVNFTFDNPKITGNAYKLWIYDTKANFVRSWNVTGAAGKGAWIGQQLSRLTSGTTYIGVTSLNRGVAGKKYNLSLTQVQQPARDTAPSAEGCLAEGELPGDEYENDTLYKANPLALGAKICGHLASKYDADIYKFTSSGGKHRFDFTFEDPKVSGNAYKVWLYNDSDDFVKSWNVTGSAGKGAWLSKQITALPKGSGYLKISPLNDKVAGKKYQLSVSQVSSKVADTASATEGCLAEGELPGDEYENDTLYKANSLALGAKICGHLASTADMDTFRFPAAAGTYRITLAYANVYDPASTYYFTVTARDANEKTLRTWKLNAGDWKGKAVDLRFPKGAAYVTVATTSNSFVGEQYKLTVALLKADPRPAFIDVPVKHKFYTEIQWMKTSGRTTGVKTAKGLAYQPKSAVSREAMAAFLFRQSAPKGFKAPRVSPFVDVPTNHKFYREISWMAQAKISTGIKKGGKRYYEPKSAVSREAMAAFLYRLEGPGKGKAPARAPFVDVPRGHKFAKEIAWMKSSGITTGSKSSRGPVYQPKSQVSREAMAAFLYRVAKR